MAYRLILTVGLSCVACLRAMDGGEEEQTPKRRRVDDSYLLLMSKGIRYDIENNERITFATLTEQMEGEIRSSGHFDCFICTNRFTRTRRIVELPCGKHHVCEECAIKLLCPSAQHHAPVKQCPACREQPSNQMAARTLFSIAHRQVELDGKLLSLRQAQGLFMDKPDEEDDDLTADAIAAALGANANAEQDTVDVTVPDGTVRHVVFDPNIPPFLRALILSQLRRTGELPPEPPLLDERDAE